MSNEEDTIRLVVKVTKDGHPELYEELSQRPQSFRAERIRMLAALSLMGAAMPHVGLAAATPTRPGAPALPPQPEQAPEVDPEEEARRREQEELERKRHELKNSLRKGFEEV